MPNVVLSPNMSMPVPVVGVDPGPDWANNINASLGILDQHDHTPGRGLQITPDGMNINTDLPFNDNNLTTVKTVNFAAQGAPLAGLSPNLGAVYIAGNELYYNDEAGNVVQITNNGTVNAGAGSISGLPSGTASVSYVSGNGTYVFQSATATPGNLDGGSIIIREVAANAKGITLSSVTGLAADYTLTLPSGLPSTSGQAIISDTSGNLTYAPLTATTGAVVGPGGYSTFAAAIAATSSGDKITVLKGTYTENVTLSSPRTIIGTGYGSTGSVLSGNWTFASGSNDSILNQMRITGNLTINSGVSEISVSDVWVTTKQNAINNGTGNYFQGFWG